MALSNADNPTVDPPAPPEPVVKVEVAGVDVTEHVVEPAVVPVPKKAAKAKPEEPVLVKSSTSGSAEVHNLVAQWEIASSNKDKAHMAAVEAQLAELGYRI